MGIIAFFVLIFAMRVRVTLELQDELALSVTILGITIKILPKKQKKYNIKNYTPKKIAKRDKKAAEKAKIAAEKKAAKEAEKKRKAEEKKKLTPAEKKAIKAKKKASMPPIPKMLSLFTKIAGMFFSGLFSKFHFHVARIKIRVGASDAATAALMYVGICHALKPTLKFLEKHSNLHGMNTAEIDIAPDYLSEDLKMDLKLGFSTSLGGILGVLFRVAFKFIFGWIKIKPVSVSQTPSTPKSTQKSNENPKLENNSEHSSNDV